MHLNTFTFNVIKLNHKLSRYMFVISIYPRIEFLWPMQPFHKMLFVRSSATGLGYIFNLKRVLVSNVYSLQFRLIECSCDRFVIVVTESVHFSEKRRRTTKISPDHFSSYSLSKTGAIFEIRTLSHTLNLYGRFVCLRGISSPDRNVYTRTSFSLFGLTSSGLVSIVR